MRGNNFLKLKGINLPSEIFIMHKEPFLIDKRVQKREGRKERKKGERRQRRERLVSITKTLKANLPESREMQMRIALRYQPGKK